MFTRSRGIQSAICLAAIGFFSILSPARSLSAEIAGLQFDEEIVIGDVTLQLKSLAVKKATFLNIDVYAIGVYLEAEPLSVETIFTSQKTKALVMKFLRNIKGDKLAESWLQDLGDSCESGCESLMVGAREIAGKLPDVKSGQKITYAIFLNRVEVSVEGKSIGTLWGPDASQSVLAAVFGKRAPRQLRADLLIPLRRLK